MPEILPSIIYLNRDRNQAAGQEAIVAVPGDRFAEDNMRALRPGPRL